MRKTQAGVIVRREAIRLKCMDCCCQQQAKVRKCHISKCALWLYRMGKAPVAEEIEVVNAGLDYWYGNDDGKGDE